MAKYIDKNKILDRLDRLMHIATEPPMDADDKAQWVLLRELHKEVSEIPTADVEEVKHGEWNENGRCSNCDWYMPFDCERNAFESDFCPHCGARMDGKDIKVPTTDGGKEE